MNFKNNSLSIVAGHWLLLVTVFILAVTETAAQSAADRMNDIKLSGRYLTAEATAHEQDKAFVAAFNMLQYNINMEQVEAGQPAVTARQLESHVKSIDIERGHDVMVFVYVERARLALMQDAQPSGGFSANDNSSPSDSRSPAVAQSQTFSATDLAALPAVIIQLLQTETFVSAQWILDNACNAGTVSSYGSPRTMAVTDGCYILVVDENKDVVTVLSPKAGGKRTNLRSGETADMGGFKGCAAVCVRVE